jgi:hypothetical protein
MKHCILILSAILWLAIVADAADTNTFEYATIRWDGDNTYVLLPSGKADYVGTQLKTLKKPDRVDERLFYLHVTMNSLGSQGYEFAGITGDGNSIVMKRKINQ